MNPSNLTYPEHLVQPSESDVKLFKKLIWNNSEVCNNCFQRIRDVGDVAEKRTDLFVHKFNTSYGRTDHGSQEHDPFLAPSDRYGQCYCLDCGADTSASKDDLSIAEMQERVRNIGRYLIEQTDRDIDPWAMTGAVSDLKGIHDNGGYDSEIFCVATVRGISRAKHEKSGSTVSV